MRKIRPLLFKRSFFLSYFAKILHSFFNNSYLSTCKDLQNTIVLSSGPLYKYLHLQYNVFVIYDESKAVHQRPSHDRVSQKHANNWQEKLTGEHLPQKRDSNKAAAMHLYWNHTSAWVPPPHGRSFQKHFSLLTQIE